MPQPFNSGPVLWFLSFRNLPWEFLGTVEGPTEPDFDPQYEPVFNDLSGTKIPFDCLMESEQAFISGTFTNWTESVYARLAAATGSDPLGSVRGTIGPREIGTLMILEREVFKLALIYPYSLPGTFTFKSAMVGQPAGYVFGGCFKVKHRRRSGTGANKLFIAVHALPVNGRLYSTNTTALPPTNLITTQLQASFVGTARVGG